MTKGKLIDSLGRIHNNLRISVTDRCNIRCFYCMPDENIQFKPRNEILTFEEIVRFARVAAQQGVNKLRLTGGEPLVRAGLPKLIRQLATIPDIDDIALTTNGILLAEHVDALKRAGLRRLNISLDGLKEETFERIARRKGLDRVLQGIFAAKAAGFERTRLNAIAIRGITESEIVPLGEFARQHGLELRFIEFMPLDAEGNWSDDQVLSGEDIRQTLQEAFGPLVPTVRPDPSQPAMDYRFADGVGTIGFINPVTQPFCSDCNRLRITAEGNIRNCLFSIAEWDARKIMRCGGSDDDLVRLLHECIAAKKSGHGIDSPDFVKPERAMYQIGG
ncbi:MAG: GTP 3',8-cyclase MoaA [Planctomycetaceae bacterium]|nr:GTP 3',8-cyclase MoaA [Planctomycetaceae bacterium]